MSDWQPIETAPKDGTDILVTVGTGGRCHVVAWLDEHGEPSAEYGWWRVDDNKHGPYSLRGASPTHWMPLPDPPSNVSGQGKESR